MSKGYQQFGQVQECPKVNTITKNAFYIGT